MIHIQNVDFAYNKNKILFQNLDLSLEPGKVYGLLGKNGTGKSTMLKLMLGCLFPQAGNIRVGNYNPSDRKADMLEEFFYMPEEFIYLNLKPQEYLQAYRGFYPKFDDAVFLEIAQSFNIPPENAVKNMSYGQKKKFHLAFGLACKAKYVLLDEPTNGLDIPSKSQFRKILARHISEEQIVILSTHQVRDLSNLIEAVIILEEGKIVLEKNLMDIESNVQFVFSQSNTVTQKKHCTQKRCQAATFIFLTTKTEKQQMLI